LTKCCRALTRSAIVVAGSGEAKRRQEDEESRHKALVLSTCKVQFHCIS